MSEPTEKQMRLREAIDSYATAVIYEHASEQVLKEARNQVTMARLELVRVALGE